MAKPPLIGQAAEGFLEMWERVDDVRRFIDAGSLEVLPADAAARAYAEIVARYPTSRATTRVVEWLDVPRAAELNWWPASDDETSRWAAQTTAGQHALAVVVVDPERECIAGEFDFVIRNLELLLYPSFHQALLLGGERRPDGTIAISCDLIELGYGLRLFGVTSD